jgi:acetyl esterase/lipase
MPLDPDLQMLEHLVLPDFHDPAVVREWARGLAAGAPPLDPALTRNIEISDQAIPGSQGALSIPIRIYRPALDGPAPVLVYFHGGSFLMGDLDTDHIACLKYAGEARCVVISVAYRLAPEHRFPAGVEDCYTALTWTAANAAALGVDARRIAIGGSSAGGTLAAALAIMTRDRQGPRPVLQMLIYPALDDRMLTPSINSSGPIHVVSRAVVGHMWRHYLGGAGVAASPYAAPARITDFTALAPAYIETCELDPLRDEVMAYAMRMLQGGISADVQVLAGAPHAFDLVLAAPVTQRAYATRAAVLHKAFRGHHLPSV